MDRLEFSFKEDSRGQSIKTDVYYSTDTVSSLPRPIGNAPSIAMREIGTHET